MDTAASITLVFVFIAAFVLSIFNSFKEKPYKSKLQQGNFYNNLQERDAALRRGYANVDEYIIAKRNGTVHKVKELPVRQVSSPKAKEKRLSAEHLIGSTVNIEYTDLDGVITKRTITIEDVYDDTKKVKAHCHLRNGTRHFFCDKMNVTAFVDLTEELKAELQTIGIVA